MLARALNPRRQDRRRDEIKRIFAQCDDRAAPMTSPCRPMPSDAGQAKTPAASPTTPAAAARHVPEYDESLRAVVEALGIPVPRWINCCGTAAATPPTICSAWPAGATRPAEAQASTACWRPAPATPARLGLPRGGREDGLPRACPRSSAARSEHRQVFNASSRTSTAAHDEKVAHAGGANPSLRRQACRYYGCLLVRPPEVAGGDDPEAPEFMDDVIAACGAEAIDWNMKVECCGGSFSVSRTSSVVRLGRSIIEDARRNGAEAIVVACPLCHSNLDLRQKAMTARGEQPLPILFITQVVGLAIGLPAESSA
jgi:heterodisulfide reductase subunit B